MKKLDAVTFDHAEDALADSVEEAANWKLRNELMDSIIEVIESHGWKQKDAATHCGITQPRLNELLKNRVSRFSLDALVNIGARIGVSLTVYVQAA